MDISVYYATNRAHEGDDRFQPLRYGSRFSSDGMENLRFGRVTFSADAAQVNALLEQDRPNCGPGDGEALQDYFAKCIGKTQRIEAYVESIPDGNLNEATQKKVLLGSKAMFADLQADMQQGRDMLLLIHGYNVSWEEAVGSAAALEATMNRPDRRHAAPTTTRWPRPRRCAWCSSPGPPTARPCLSPATRATAPTPQVRPARSAAAC